MIKDKNMPDGSSPTTTWVVSVATLKTKTAIEHLLKGKSKRDVIQLLERLIQEWDDVYFNTNREAVSDLVYNFVKEYLQHLAPNSLVLKKVGHAVKTGTGRRPKETLPNPMPSIDNKIKTPEQLNRWVADNPGPWLVSDKLDGVSIQLVYRKITLVPKAYTRGNGTQGQNISELVPHLVIPATLSLDLTVRGEMIMPEAVFNSKYAKHYKNARALTSGIASKSGAHRAVKDIHVVIYQVIGGAGNTGKPSEQLARLQKLGFKTAPFVVLKSMTFDSLSKLLAQRRSRSAYHLDGLVLIPDTPQRASRSVSAPPWIAAFKPDSIDNMARTEVTEIEWNVSKDGYLIPRIKIKPVRLAGVTVTWATGHHANNVIDNKIGPGAIIEITRAGETIPYVTRVIKPAKASWPSKGEFPHIEWTESGVDLRLSQRATEDHQDVQMKRLARFLRTLGADGIDLGVLVRLFEAGINTLKKLLTVSDAELLKIPGFRDRSVRKMLTEIDRVVTDVPLDLLIDASGLFGRGFGTDKSKKLIATIPDLLQRVKGAKSNARVLVDLEDDITAIPGFSETSARATVRALPQFVAWLKQHPEITYIVPVPKKRGNKLAGKVFVFTDFRDDELEAKIEAQGGRVSGSVSSKTTAVLTPNKNSPTVKAVKARALGILMTVDEFERKYL